MECPQRIKLITTVIVFETELQTNHFEILKSLYTAFKQKSLQDYDALIYLKCFHDFGC